MPQGSVTASEAQAQGKGSFGKPFLLCFPYSSGTVLPVVEHSALPLEGRFQGPFVTGKVISVLMLDWSTLPFD